MGVKTSEERAREEPDRDEVNRGAIREAAVLKGALAGLIGGIVGTGAKIMAEAIVPPFLPGQTPPQVLLAERAAGGPLDPEERKVSMNVLHWGFGVLAGAAYGALAELHPKATAWRGVAFGLALNKFTHEGLLPEAHLVPPVERQPTQERVSQWVTHVVYGAVTDAVRRGVRTGIE